MIDYCKIVTATNTFDNPHIEALLYRGFLIERKGDEFYLSDNSYLKQHHIDMLFHDETTDDEYLHQFLTRNKFGSIDNARRILLRSDIPINTFCDMLFSECLVIQGESGYIRFREKWHYFKQHERSFKIPVATLEPFIAFLVKAFSSIGISTYSSCNGYNRNKFDITHLHISFIGEYNSLWAKNIYECIIQPHMQPLHSSLNFNNGSMTIERDNAKSIEDIFIEIHKIALAIYNNRIKLVSLKRNFCTQYDAVMKKYDKEFDYKRDIPLEHKTQIGSLMKQFLLQNKGESQLK